MTHRGPCQPLPCWDSVCGFGLFSLMKTSTSPPLLLFICSFIVGWLQFWRLLIFLLVRSTGLSHSWAGWRLLPSPCSPSSCISFHWDTSSLSGVSKAFFNCLCHLEKTGFLGMTYIVSTFLYLWSWSCPMMETDRLVKNRNSVKI